MVSCHDRVHQLVFSFYVTTNEKNIGFFSRFIGEKSVFGRHGNDFDKIKSEEKKSEKIRYFPDFSMFFPFVPWLKKYEKISFEGFRTHPKCLEVAPSSHQAIDYT